MKNFERYINELAADFEKNGHDCMLPMKRQCHLHDRCVECFISWALDDPEIPQENACPELIDLDEIKGYVVTEHKPICKMVTIEHKPIYKQEIVSNHDICNLDLFGETP